MKMVVNRKEWRDRTVMTLIQAKSIDAHTAIAQAEVLEAYVFRDDFIVEIADPDQRAALKKIVEEYESVASLANQSVSQEVKHFENYKDLVLHICSNGACQRVSIDSSILRRGLTQMLDHQKSTFFGMFKN